MPRPPTRIAPVVEEELDDDVCVYLPATNQAMVLNRTAADVWRLLDGQTSVETIITALAHAYSVDADDIRADVLAVVDDLRSRGFLSESSD